MTQYYIATDATALTAATAKTILELPTPANTVVNLNALWVGCDATVQGSLKIEFGTFTTTGTGTAATPQKTSGDRTIDSSISAAKVKDTVEPTSFTPGTVGALYYPGIIWPLPGAFIYQWPMSQEFAVTESLNFGIRLTATTTCNATLVLFWEE